MLNNKKSDKGFTLIEVILSIGIISLIGAFSVPVYRSLQTNNDFNIVVDESVSSLRRAQALSRSMQEDSSWGVNFDDSITIFLGSSYASRDQDYDEIFDKPDSITFSGNTEFVFDKLSGDPVSTGSLSVDGLTSSTTISINEEGSVIY